MVSITKLNNQDIVINSDLIEYIEATPDTTITMTNGHKIIARESVQDIINKIIDYKREIFTKF